MGWWIDDHSNTAYHSTAHPRPAGYITYRLYHRNKQSNHKAAAEPAGRSVEGPWAQQGQHTAHQQGQTMGKAQNTGIQSDGFKQ